MAIVTKKSSMIFYSDHSDQYSHRVRIVLAEKGVLVDIHDVSPDNIPESLSEVNPYNTLPTLIDRDLVLYEPNVMMEYLDERFPHPPLLPVYPVARAQSRLMMHRIQKDWCSLVDIIVSKKTTDNATAQARKELRESLTSVSPVFEEKPFFMSSEFSLIDCCLVPILWRLTLLEVVLPSRAKGIMSYIDRVFDRESFRVSLSDVEREMRI